MCTRITCAPASSTKEKYAKLLGYIPLPLSHPSVGPLLYRKRIKRREKYVMLQKLHRKIRVNTKNK